MRYIRRHFQMNLIDRDIKTLKPGQSTAPEIEDEIFEINKFFIFSNTGSWEFTDDRDVSEIIESEDYFSMISGDKSNLFCLNKKNVERFEFVLTEPTTTAAAAATAKPITTTTKSIERRKRQEFMNPVYSSRSNNSSSSSSNRKERSNSNRGKKKN